MDYVLVAGLAILVGGALGFISSYLLYQSRLSTHGLRLEELRRQAAMDAEKIVHEAELKAKDDLYRQREELRRETEEMRAELREHERRLDKREDNLEEKGQAQQRKERALEQEQKKLKDRQKEVERRAEEVEKLIQDQMTKLHEISGLGREQAEKLLLERLDKDLSRVIAGRIQRAEEQMKQTCEEKARRILALAIQRYAAEHTADSTV